MPVSNVYARTCCPYEPFLLDAARIFMCLSSHKLNKCHTVHSIPFVTTAIVCLPWIHTELVLMRDPRYFIQREYQGGCIENTDMKTKLKCSLLEVAALKQPAETCFGRSFSYFRDVWERFDIFISNCLFFEV